MQIIMYVVRRLARALVLVAADLVVVAVRKLFFKNSFTRSRFATPMAF